MREIHGVIREYSVLVSRWMSLSSGRLGACQGRSIPAPQPPTLCNAASRCKADLGSARVQGGTGSPGIADGKEIQRKINQRRILLMPRNLNTCELGSARLPRRRELNG